MFPEAERQIFKFWDGERERKVDPLAIYRKLASTQDFDLQADVTKSADGDTQAMSRVLCATRDVFGIKEFAEVDGNVVGLLDSEVFQLIWKFGEFCQDIKKNTWNAPTSSQPTDISEEQSTTNASSDCG